MTVAVFATQADAKRSADAGPTPTGWRIKVWDEGDRWKWCFHKSNVCIFPDMKNTFSCIISVPGDLPGTGGDWNTTKGGFVKPLDSVTVEVKSFNSYHTTQKTEANELAKELRALIKVNEGIKKVQSK